MGKGFIMNVFETLNKINVNEYTEEKNGLTYLSWAYAWKEFKKVCPDATYEVVKFDGKPYVYDENLGYMCYTTVTVNGLTHEMWLPVMDGANKAMKSEPYEYMVKNNLFKYAKKAPDGKYYDNYGNEQTKYITKVCEAATMFDINKTIMRCLVKNLAMFGLGLYIYAGEDLPEEEKEKANKPITEKEVEILKAMCKRKGVPSSGYNGKKFEILTATEYTQAIKQLGAMKDAVEN